MRAEPKNISPWIAWSLIALAVGFLLYSLWYYYTETSTIWLDSSVSMNISFRTHKNNTNPDTVSTISTSTYTNSTYGFSFSYPSSWTATEKKNVNDELMYINLMTTSDIGKYQNSDYPGLANIYIVSSLESLDEQNLNPANLQEYMNKYANLEDPLYMNVQKINIGGKDGFTAKIASNQFGGGKAYLVQLNSGQIINIRTYSTGITDKQGTELVNSFIFK